MPGEHGFQPGRAPCYVTAGGTNINGVIYSLPNQAFGNVRGRSLSDPHQNCQNIRQTTQHQQTNVNHYVQRPQTQPPSHGTAQNATNTATVELRNQVSRLIGLQTLEHYMSNSATPAQAQIVSFLTVKDRTASAAAGASASFVATNSTDFKCTEQQRATVISGSDSTSSFASYASSQERIPGAGLRFASTSVSELKYAEHPKSVLTSRSNSTTGLAAFPTLHERIPVAGTRTSFASTNSSNFKCTESPRAAVISRSNSATGLAAFPNLQERIPVPGIRTSYVTTSRPGFGCTEQPEAVLTSGSNSTSRVSSFQNLQHQVPVPGIRTSFVSNGIPDLRFAEQARVITSGNYSTSRPVSFEAPAVGIRPSYVSTNRSDLKSAEPYRTVVTSGGNYTARPASYETLQEGTTAVGMRASYITTNTSYLKYTEPYRTVLSSGSSSTAGPASFETPRERIPVAGITTSHLSTNSLDLKCPEQPTRAVLTSGGNSTSGLASFDTLQQRIPVAGTRRSFVATQSSEYKCAEQSETVLTYGSNSTAAPASYATSQDRIPLAGTMTSYATTSKPGFICDEQPEAALASGNNSTARLSPHATLQNQILVAGTTTSFPTTGNADFKCQEPPQTVTMAMSGNKPAARHVSFVPNSSSEFECREHPEPVHLKMSETYLPNDEPEFKRPEQPKPVLNKTKVQKERATLDNSTFDPKSPAPPGGFTKEFIDFIQSPRVPDAFDEEEDEEEAGKFWICDADVYKRDQESRRQNGNPTQRKPFVIVSTSELRNAPRQHPIITHAPSVTRHALDHYNKGYSSDVTTHKTIPETASSDVHKRFSNDVTASKIITEHSSSDDIKRFSSDVTSSKFKKKHDSSDVIKRFVSDVTAPTVRSFDTVVYKNMVFHPAPSRKTSDTSVPARMNSRHHQNAQDPVSGFGFLDTPKALTAAHKRRHTHMQKSVEEDGIPATSDTVNNQDVFVVSVRNSPHHQNAEDSASGFGIYKEAQKLTVTHKRKRHGHMQKTTEEDDLPATSDIISNKDSPAVSVRENSPHHQNAPASGLPETSKSWTSAENLKRLVPMQECTKNDASPDLSSCCTLKPHDTGGNAVSESGNVAGTTPPSQTLDQVKRKLGSNAKSPLAIVISPLHHNTKSGKPKRRARNAHSCDEPTTKTTAKAKVLAHWQGSPEVASFITLKPLMQSGQISTSPDFSRISESSREALGALSRSNHLDSDMRRSSPRKQSRSTSDLSQSSDLIKSTLETHSESNHVRSDVPQKQPSSTSDLHQGSVVCEKILRTHSKTKPITRHGNKASLPPKKQPYYSLDNFHSVDLNKKTLATQSKSKQLTNHANMTSISPQNHSVYPAASTNNNNNNNHDSSEAHLKSKTTRKNARISIKTGNKPSITSRSQQQQQQLSNSLESWFSSKQTTSLEMHVVGNYPAPRAIFQQKSSPPITFAPTTFSQDAENSKKTASSRNSEHILAISKAHDIVNKVLEIAYSKTLKIPPQANAVTSSNYTLAGKNSHGVLRKSPPSCAVSSIAHPSSTSTQHPGIATQKEATADFSSPLSPSQLTVLQKMVSRSSATNVSSSHNVCSSISNPSPILVNSSIDQPLDFSVKSKPKPSLALETYPDEPLDYSMKSSRRNHSKLQDHQIEQKSPLDLSLPMMKKNHNKVRNEQSSTSRAPSTQVIASSQLAGVNTRAVNTSAIMNNSLKKLQHIEAESKPYQDERESVPTLRVEKDVQHEAILFENEASSQASSVVVSSGVSEGNTDARTQNLDSINLQTLCCVAMSSTISDAESGSAVQERSAERCVDQLQNAPLEAPKLRLESVVEKNVHGIQPTTSNQRREDVSRHSEPEIGSYIDITRTESDYNKLEDAETSPAQRDTLNDSRESKGPELKSSILSEDEEGLDQISSCDTKTGYVRTKTYLKSCELKDAATSPVQPEALNDGRGSRSSELEPSTLTEHATTFSMAPSGETKARPIRTISDSESSELKTVSEDAETSLTQSVTSAERMESENSSKECMRSPESEPELVHALSDGTMSDQIANKTDCKFPGFEDIMKVTDTPTRLGMSDKNIEPKASTADGLSPKDEASFAVTLSDSKSPGLEITSEDEEMVSSQVEKPSENTEPRIFAADCLKYPERDFTQSSSREISFKSEYLNQTKQNDFMDFDKNSDNSSNHTEESHHEQTVVIERAATVAGILSEDDESGLVIDESQFHLCESTAPKTQNKIKPPMETLLPESEGKEPCDKPVGCSNLNQSAIYTCESAALENQDETNSQKKHSIKPILESNEPIQEPITLESELHGQYCRGEMKYSSDKRQIPNNMPDGHDDQTNSEPEIELDGTVIEFSPGWIGEVEKEKAPQVMADTREDYEVAKESSIVISAVDDFLENCTSHSDVLKAPQRISEDEENHLLTKVAQETTQLVTKSVTVNNFRESLENGGDNFDGVGACKQQSISCKTTEMNLGQVDEFPKSAEILEQVKKQMVLNCDECDEELVEKNASDSHTMNEGECQIELHILTGTSDGANGLHENEKATYSSAEPCLISDETKIEKTEVENIRVGVPVPLATDIFASSESKLKLFDENKVSENQVESHSTTEAFETDSDEKATLTSAELIFASKKTENSEARCQNEEIGTQALVHADEVCNLATIGAKEVSEKLSTPNFSVEDTNDSLTKKIQTDLLKVAEKGEAITISYQTLVWQKLVELPLKNVELSACNGEGASYHTEGGKSSKQLKGDNFVELGGETEVNATAKPAVTTSEVDHELFEHYRGSAEVEMNQQIETGGCIVENKGSVDRGTGVCASAQLGGTTKFHENLLEHNFGSAEAGKDQQSDIGESNFENKDSGHCVESNSFIEIGDGKPEVGTTAQIDVAVLEHNILEHYVESDKSIREKQIDSQIEKGESEIENKNDEIADKAKLDDEIVFVPTNQCVAFKLSSVVNSNIEDVGKSARIASDKTTECTIEIDCGATGDEEISDDVILGIGTPSERRFSETQEFLEMNEPCCDEYDNMFLTEDESDYDADEQPELEAEKLNDNILTDDAVDGNTGDESGSCAEEQTALQTEKLTHNLKVVDGNTGKGWIEIQLHGNVNETESPSDEQHESETENPNDNSETSDNIEGNTEKQFLEAQGDANDVEERPELQTENLNDNSETSDTIQGNTEKQFLEAQLDVNDEEERPKLQTEKLTGNSDARYDVYGNDGNPLPEIQTKTTVSEVDSPAENVSQPLDGENDIPIEPSASVHHIEDTNGGSADREFSVGSSNVVKTDHIGFADETLGDEKVSENNSLDMGKNAPRISVTRRFGLREKKSETTDCFETESTNAQEFDTTPPSTSISTLIPHHSIVSNRFGYGTDALKRKSPLKLGYNARVNLTRCDVKVKRRKLVKKDETSTPPKVPKTSPKQATYILLSDSSSGETEGIFKTKKVKKKSRRKEKSNSTSPILSKQKSPREEKNTAFAPSVKDEPVEQIAQENLTISTSDNATPRFVAEDKASENTQQNSMTNNIVSGDANDSLDSRFRSTRRKTQPPCQFPKHDTLEHSLAGTSEPVSQTLSSQNEMENSAFTESWKSFFIFKTKRKRNTIPMKSFSIGLVDNSGDPPSRKSSHEDTAWETSSTVVSDISDHPPFSPPNNRAPNMNTSTPETADIIKNDLDGEEIPTPLQIITSGFDSDACKSLLSPTASEESDKAPPKAIPLKSYVRNIDTHADESNDSSVSDGGERVITRGRQHANEPKIVNTGIAPDSGSDLWNSGDGSEEEYTPATRKKLPIKKRKKRKRIQSDELLEFASMIQVARLAPPKQSSRQTLEINSKIESKLHIELDNIDTDSVEEYIAENQSLDVADENSGPTRPGLLPELSIVSDHDDDALFTSALPSKIEVPGVEPSPSCSQHGDGFNADIDENFLFEDRSFDGVTSNPTENAMFTSTVSSTSELGLSCSQFLSIPDAFSADSEEQSAQRQRKSSARIKGNWKDIDIPCVTQLKIQPLPWYNPEKLSKAERNQNIFSTMQKLIDIGLVKDRTPRSKKSILKSQRHLGKIGQNSIGYKLTETLKQSKKKLQWFSRKRVNVKPCTIPLKKLNIQTSTVRIFTP